MPAPLDVPFPDYPLDEVYLPTPPLLAIVSQVRFPAIASIAREDFIGPFQEEIRADYAVMRPEREVSLVITPQGISSSGDQGPIWRFVDKAADWAVTLAPSFVALHTKANVTSGAFVGRLDQVLHALADTVAPATVERFGLRYIDRIELSPGTRLETLVRPEVLGISCLDPGPQAEMRQTLTDSFFSTSSGTLHARWGVFPPNAQADPIYGDPVGNVSWLLDLDMFVEGSDDFDVAKLTSRARDFARHIYSFFRWVVTDELLQQAGAEL